MRHKRFTFVSTVLFTLLLLSAAFSEVITGLVDVHSKRAGMFAMKTEEGFEIVSYSEGTMFLNMEDEAEIERDMLITVEGRRDQVVFISDFITAKPVFHKKGITPLSRNELKRENLQGGQSS